jgi:CheY-like chemotaxis protein
VSERLRILVVDDEPDIPMILRSLLEPEYEVTTATNGLDALLKLPRHEPDLMVVDLMMPLMDGWELAEQVRRHPRFATIPMIFLTALDSKEDIRRGYEKGASVYLTKPFEPDRVLRNIQAIVKTDGIAPGIKQKSLQQIRMEEQQGGEGKKGATGVEPALEEKLLRKIGTAKKTGQPKTSDATPQWASPLPKPAPESPLAKLPCPPRVMLVDDDPEIIEIMRIALERGFEVVTADNGLDALRRIPEYEPDLYVLDGMMPKMSGFQLLQMLRQTRDTRHCPVVFISAKVNAKDREYARSLGANTFLAKPFKLEELVQTLEQLTLEPTFELHYPKKKSLEEILAEEGILRVEEEERQKQKSYWKRYEALEEFLRRHADKDPFTGKPEPDSES